MPARRVLRINDETRAELEWAVVHHPLPYVREKASALRKLDRGLPVTQVASADYGLRKRHPSTIRGWMDAIESAGLAGLLVRPGRGRKPAFSP